MPSRRRASSPGSCSGSRPRPARLPLIQPSSATIAAVDTESTLMLHPRSAPAARQNGISAASSGGSAFGLGSAPASRVGRQQLALHFGPVGASQPHGSPNAVTPVSRQRPHFIPPPPGAGWTATPGCAARPAAPGDGRPQCPLPAPRCEPVERWDGRSAAARDQHGRQPLCCSGVERAASVQPGWQCASARPFGCGAERPGLRWVAFLGGSRQRRDRAAVTRIAAATRPAEWRPPTAASFRDRPGAPRDCLTVRVSVSTLPATTVFRVSGARLRAAALSERVRRCGSARFRPAVRRRHAAAPLPRASPRRYPSVTCTTRVTYARSTLKLPARQRGREGGAQGAPPRAHRAAARPRLRHARVRGGRRGRPAVLTGRPAVTDGRRPDPLPGPGRRRCRQSDAEPHP